MKSWILGAACGALIWVCGCGSQSSDSAGDGGGNAPAILSQPASQTVLAGKTISFSVVATGAEPLAYQWSKDGADIDGATSSALELADVSADNAGDYVVTVSNADGSMESDTATLEIKDLSIVVIPKGTTHEFWKSIHAGAIKAQQELEAAGQPVEIIWKGPLKEDDRDEQIKVVENFIARGVDGMVLAPLDDKALVRPVEMAGNADIPVVIIDSGLQSDKYASFVATDNYLGGRMGGAHLGKLLGGKGSVLLLRYAVGSASTTKRENGFLDELKENFPGIKMLSSDQYAGATRDLAYTASQNLLSRYGDEVKGVFCPNESVSVSMTKAVRDIGKAGGKVKIIGFDTSVQSLRDLKAGDVQGLVVQNPVKMGYLGVMTLVEHLGGKTVAKRIDTGVALVTGENMAQPQMQELLNPPLEKYLGTGN